LKILVLFPSGFIVAKYPSRIMNETKGAISLMICGNAEGEEGELLPPFVCYKAEGMFSSSRK
jgi:hypothetical protein